MGSVGRKVECSARIDGARHEGVAELESTELLFRASEVRLRIPFAKVTAVHASGARLTLEHAGATAVFELGPEAKRWAEKIRNPPSLVDKLGVKPGSRVSVLNVDDPEFLSQLTARTPNAHIQSRRVGCDLIVLGVGDRTDLRRIRTLRSFIVANGAVWVVWRKGSPDVNENDVRDAALAAGLVDVKVVSFSATHSALKLVIRVADRHRDHR